MATVNLYVSDALKAEMAELKDLPWSRIASEAFRNAIDLERTRNMIPVEEHSLARLRASREQSNSMREAEAYATGKQWALDVASYEELAAVAALAELPDEAWDGEPNAYGWLAGLMEAIYGEDAWNRGDCEQFGEQYFGNRYPSGEAVREFINGAAEVFEQV